jgi:hypothetical protein
MPKIPMIQMHSLVKYLMQTQYHQHFVRKQNFVKTQSLPGHWSVAHACNPSYSVGRDQKGCSSNSSRDSISKKFTTKKWAGGVAQGVGAEFKCSTTKKQRKTP